VGENCARIVGGSFFGSVVGGCSTGKSHGRFGKMHSASWRVGPTDSGGGGRSTRGRVRTMHAGAGAGAGAGVGLGLEARQAARWAAGDAPWAGEAAGARWELGWAAGLARQAHWARRASARLAGWELGRLAWAHEGEGDTGPSGGEEGRKGARWAGRMGQERGLRATFPFLFISEIVFPFLFIYSI
jgi:hypothetical protein